MPTCKCRKADASQKLFLIVISTQVSVLSCRCTKHNKQCEQHKPLLQSPSENEGEGRPMGFQSFPASNSF